jgi:ATP phosphoribosyltransferase regulatory subunit
MRDLLPSEAKFQSGVGRDVMSAFERFGYERVWLPTFEFAEVLERTRGREGSALRFIEPETGEVVALRSDMTPQIARVVATRFGGVPRPLRLCYQGSVVRRRKERARTESQVVQAGVELVGRSGEEGDFEVIELLASAVSGTGLSDFVLDLGHSGIARALMRGAAECAAGDLRAALAAKDHAELEKAGKRAGLRGETLVALVKLPELHGADAVWPAAHACLSGTSAEPHLLDLERLWQRA